MLHFSTPKDTISFHVVCPKTWPVTTSGTVVRHINNMF